MRGATAAALVLAGCVLLACVQGEQHDAELEEEWVSRDSDKGKLDDPDYDEAVQAVRHQNEDQTDKYPSDLWRDKPYNEGSKEEMHADNVQAVPSSWQDHTLLKGALKGRGISDHRDKKRNDHASNEVSSFAEEGDDIADEAADEPDDNSVDFMETTSTSQKTARSALTNIISLKAFCLGAYRKTLKKRGRHSVLIPWILSFGKSAKGNIVAEYANLMGKLKAKYHTGLGDYLLSRINQATLYKSGIVVVSKRITGVTFGHFAALSARSLGLQLPAPALFDQLAVRLSEYEKHRVELTKSNKGADAKAATAWVVAGMKGRYKSFLEKVTAFWRTEKNKVFDAASYGAYRAEGAAFHKAEIKKVDKNTKVVVQPGAGVSGSHKVFQRINFRPPSKKKMRLEAKETAAKWATRQKKIGDNINRVVKAMERRDEGVQIRFKTKDGERTTSGQSPRVVIIGTRGIARGVIRGLPNAGHMQTQTISSRPIGTIKAIHLKASSRDGWLCQSFMAKSSSNGMWQRMRQNNFWLESRPHAKGLKAKRYLGFKVTSGIVLTPIPTRKYGLKYAGKWPHCTNIRCMAGSIKKFQKACDGSKGCIGFSLSASKAAGSGCLKKFPCNKGFGKGTHDYWQKQRRTHKKACKAMNLSATHAMTYHGCTASSKYNRSFPCKNAFQGYGRGWTTRGQGKGAWIKVRFNSHVDVSSLKFRNRYTGQGVHPQARMIRNLRLYFSNGSTQSVVLKNHRGVQTFKLRKVRTNFVKMRVRSVYALPHHRSHKGKKKGKRTSSKAINVGATDIQIWGCHMPCQPTTKTFTRLTIAAKGDKPSHSFTLPKMRVESITFRAKDRRAITCAGNHNKSPFGCGESLLGTLLTTAGIKGRGNMVHRRTSKEVLPSPVVRGYRRMAYKHAHWYKVSGYKRRSLRMTWNLKKPVILNGSYRLWYSDDLANGAEYENEGESTMSVTVRGCKYTKPRFNAKAFADSLRRKYPTRKQCAQWGTRIMRTESKTKLKGCPVCTCPKPKVWPISGCNIKCGAKCGSKCCYIRAGRHARRHRKVSTRRIKYCMRYKVAKAVKFALKYRKKWPHCTNIRCLSGARVAFKRSCSKNPKCNGFSFSTNKSSDLSHGSGCLKQNCKNNKNGFGKGSHDYYVKH